MTKHVVCAGALALFLVLASTGCTKKVRVPPRIDLSHYGTLGIASFDGPGMRPGLGADELAMREFVASVHRGQPGTPIVEIRGVSSTALRQPAELKRVAKEHGVDAMILGELHLTEVKPKLHLGQHLREGSLEASIEGTLHVSIVAGASAATLWSSSSQGSESVAHVGIERNPIAGTVPTAALGDVDTSRARLVRRLTHRVTRDFRSRIVKQR